MAITPPLNYSVTGLVVFSAIVIGIAVLSACLRFWSKIVNPRMSVGLDDYLAFAAIPFTITCIIMTFIGAGNGLGNHNGSMTEEQAILTGKCLFIGDLAFCISISFSKLSALDYYAKTFRVKSYANKRWKWAFYCVFAMTALWFVLFVPYSVVQCLPVEKFWLRSVPGECGGQFTFFFIGGVSSVLVDVAILIIPIYPLCKLKLPLGRKVYLVGAFIAGYGVVAMSIGRLVTTLEVASNFNGDTTFELVPILYWTNAECSLSTLAISLPAIFQLAKRFCHHGWGSLFNRRAYKEDGLTTRAALRRLLTASVESVHPRTGSDSSLTGGLYLAPMPAPSMRV